MTITELDQVRTAPPDPTKNRVAKRKPATAVFSKIAYAVGFVALAFTLLLAVVAIIIPAVFGATPYTVLTRSMEPGFPPGTYLVVRPIPAEDLRLGDVITYQLTSGEPEVVTHRIVERTAAADGSLRFTTQGDNNAHPDPVQVRPVQIRGKVWYAIPYLGWVADFRDAQGDVWVPVAAGLLFAYSAVQVGRWGRDKIREKRA